MDLIFQVLYIAYSIRLFVTSHNPMGMFCALLHPLIFSELFSTDSPGVTIPLTWEPSSVSYHIGPICSCVFKVAHYWSGLYFSPVDHTPVRLLSTHFLPTLAASYRHGFLVSLSCSIVVRVTGLTSFLWEWFRVCLILSQHLPSVGFFTLGRGVFSHGCPKLRSCCSWSWWGVLSQHHFPTDVGCLFWASRVFPETLFAVIPS